MRFLISANTNKKKSYSLFNGLMAKTVFSCLLILALLIEPSYAQKKGRSLPLVRDAEIEGLLRDYASPIFKAAGMGIKNTKIYLVNKPEFNAFVTGRRIFINLGAIQTALTPNEIIGVIAHETGHILGGHLIRLRQRVERAQILTVLGMLAGVGAAISGGEAGGAASGALIYGSQDALKRTILAYKREEERAADQSAFNLLEKTGQSSKGLVTTFKRFSRSLNLSSSVDPYKVSHPLPQARITFMASLAKSSRFYNKTDSKNLQFRHNMARAKIAAYSMNAGAVRRLFSKNLNSPAARYGDAIATYLSGSPSAALPKIDSLIKDFPKFAYLHEMKGEILVKSGKAREAIKPFQRAISLDKYKSGIIRIQLGQAFLETGDKALVDKAIRELKAGISRDPHTSNGYEYLARAYAIKGNNNLAIAAAAEHNFVIGRYKQAKQYARRAQKELKRATPQWLRLQDIIKYKVPKKKRS
ncbi:MAG: M48 family metalloprotease [Rhizobiaceae bacterium]|nr:M48 family metalloprotease [Rhizobiaceae bacterium]